MKEGCLQTANHWKRKNDWQTAVSNEIRMPADSGHWKRKNGWQTAASGGGERLAESYMKMAEDRRIRRKSNAVADSNGREKDG